ncbi:cholecystokinin a [Hemitrygon akajei]|uniref:cholecystokinin a n=1 Tax=Hemitrygon akajei TaxID=2704970 RepID=UPI003BF9CABC
MISRIYLCVFLAVLSSGCFGRLSSGTDVGPPDGELQHSAPMHQGKIQQALFTGQVKPVLNSEQKASLGSLLTRYLQRVRTGSLGALQKLDLPHRISDRDYMGWMDFGRRSAEEYEYSA